MPALFPTLASQLKRLATVRLLPDVINGYNLLVKGLSTSFTLPATDFSDSVIIQKDAGAATPALSVDNNVNGQHAVFGGDVMTIADSGIASGPTAPFAIGSTLVVTGLATLNAGFNALAASTVNGNLNVTAIVAVGGTLGVTGLSTLTGGFNAGASSSVTGNLAVSGNETVGGTLGVTGLSTLTGGFNALAASTVNGALNVTGIVAAHGQPIAAAPQSQPLSASYTLTNAYVALSGCAATLTPGNWIVMLVCDFLETGAGDVGQTFLGRVVVASGTATISNATAVAVLAGVTANQRATVSQVWCVNVTATAVVRAEAEKTGGTGTSQAVGTITALTAWYVGSP